MQKENHAREEVEVAFQELWRAGPVNDDWDDWAGRFTDDALYVEHLWGTFNGQREIEEFVLRVMKGAMECYGVLDWYVIDGDRVVLQSQNRRDDPEVGNPPIDFVGWEILEYAGGGKWSFCRDIYWFAEARAATKRYHEQCMKHDPDHPSKRTRLHVPDGPDWTVPTSGHVPRWLSRDDIVQAVRPSDLAIGVRHAEMRHLGDSGLKAAWGS